MIPREATMAALYALFPDEPDMEDFKSVFWQPTIQTILEAAAPFIAAHVAEPGSAREAMALAWDEGYGAADEDAPHSIKTPNPYREATR